MSQLPQRRTVRLRGYDYSRAGAYFITICSYNRGCLFGTIREGQPVLSKIGLAVEDEWVKASQMRATVETDAFVVMPNHFHAVLFIKEATGTARRAPTDEREAFGKPTPGSLPTIVRSFKAAVARRVNDLR